MTNHLEIGTTVYNNVYNYGLVGRIKAIKLKEDLPIHVEYFHAEHFGIKEKLMHEERMTLWSATKLLSLTPYVINGFTELFFYPADSEIILAKNSEEEAWKEVMFSHFYLSRHEEIICYELDAKDLRTANQLKFSMWKKSEGKIAIPKYMIDEIDNLKNHLL